MSESLKAVIGSRTAPAMRARGSLLPLLVAMIGALSLAGCASTSPTGEIARMTMIGNSTSANPNAAPEIVGYSVFASAPEGFKNIRKGHGRIFVMRPDKFYGSAADALIATVGDNRNIAIANGGCVTWEEPTGKYTVRFDRALALGHIIALPATQQAVATLSIQDGVSYYLDLYDGNDGWRLTQLPAKQGEAMIAGKFKPVALYEDH